MQSCCLSASILSDHLHRGFFSYLIYPSRWASSARSCPSTIPRTMMFFQVFILLTYCATQFLGNRLISSPSVHVLLYAAHVKSVNSSASIVQVSAPYLRSHSEFMCWPSILLIRPSRQCFIVQCSLLCLRVRSFSVSLFLKLF